MERNQRRRGRPGREHRPESSRRLYSDEQETYRNPRNEYRDEDERGDDHERSRYGSSDYRNRDRDFDESEPNRYGASERGYGYGDYGYREDSRDREEPGYGARRRGQSRDVWEESGSGNFSDIRTRWPRDDRPPLEPRSQNWPHSRTGGRVSEYGYFGDEEERSGYGGRHHGRSESGSPYGYREQGGSQPGYGRQQGGSEYANRRSGEDYSGRGPRNYSRSDERIKEDICDELSADPECDAQDIDIEVNDGMVSLSGTVPSRKMKHRAEDIADSARGVKDVDNRIRVTGRIGQSEQRGSGSSQGPRGGGDDASSSPNGSSRKKESQQSRGSGRKSS